MASKEKKINIVSWGTGSIEIINNYTQAELDLIYRKMISKLSQLIKPIKIEEVVDVIIEQFHPDPEKFFSALPVNHDEALKAKYGFYQSLSSLFIKFKVENLVARSNIQSLIEDPDDYEFDAYIKHLDSLSPEEADQVIEEQLFENKEDKIKKDSKLSLSKINNMEHYLQKRVIGQEEAIKVLINSTKLVASGLGKRTSVMLLGSTGTGKTLLAREFANVYTGRIIFISGVEYSQGHEMAKLLGSPPGYIGHSSSNLLLDKANESNSWVFVIDELEKSHPKFLDLLLNLIEDGEITDNSGNLLDFTESFFIFTSNTGMRDIKYNDNVGFQSNLVTYENSKDKVMRSVKNTFSPEFINRIDSFIYFNSLNEDNAREIIKLELDYLPINKSKNLIDFILKNSYSKEYGARNIKRFIKSEFAIKVAEYVLKYGNKVRFKFVNSKDGYNLFPIKRREISNVLDAKK